MIGTVTRADVLAAGTALLVSVFLADLLPGPTVILAVAVGVVGWVQVRRGRPIGRRLLAIFAGMLAAILVIVILAVLQS